MALANSDVDRVAEAISMLFHPHVEVALHDLPSGRIVRLWNPISGRRPGDESLIEPDFQGHASSESVIGPYEQVDIRGHRTTSVSVPVDEGRMLLCINFDRSALDGAIAVLMSLAAAHVERPAELFARDWRVRINESIADWCASRNLVARDLDKAVRGELVKHLDHEGLFETRKAAEHVATALGVSRATVYNLRKELS
jgi:predicted transcriptional regulator YheO